MKTIRTTFNYLLIKDSLVFEKHRYKLIKNVIALITLYETEWDIYKMFNYNMRQNKTYIRCLIRCLTITWDRIRQN